MSRQGRKGAHAAAPATAAAAVCGLGAGESYCLILDTLNGCCQGRAEEGAHAAAPATAATAVCGLGAGERYCLILDALKGCCQDRAGRVRTLLRQQQQQLFVWYP